MTSSCYVIKTWMTGNGLLSYWFTGSLWENAPKQTMSSGRRVFLDLFLLISPSSLLRPEMATKAKTHPSFAAGGCIRGYSVTAGPNSSEPTSLLTLTSTSSSLATFQPFLETGICPTIRLVRDLYLKAMPCFRTKDTGFFFPTVGITRLILRLALPDVSTVAHRPRFKHSCCTWHWSWYQ